jgi:hypothetical protein
MPQSLPTPDDQKALSVYTMRVSAEERALLSEIGVEAARRGLRIGEYLAGLYRERPAGKDAAEVAEAAEQPKLTYADGYAVGRLAGELAAAFSWHLDDRIPLGDLRAWVRQRPILAGYVAQALAEEPFGERFLRWWSQKLVEPDRADRAFA